MWLSAEMSPALQPKLNMADRTGFDQANLLPRPRLGMSNCMDRSENSPFATSLRSMWLSAEMSPALQPKLNMADRTGFQRANLLPRPGGILGGKWRTGRDLNPRPPA